MPQLIIGMIIKNYLPKILGLFALMLIGISASIWFLDGWPAFFASFGVFIACLIAIPVIIILGLIKTFKLGKDVKNFLLRKSSKGELMSAIIQGVGTYMMGEQMSKMFSMMAAPPESPNKTVNTQNIEDAEVKSSFPLNSLDPSITLASGASAAGAVALASSIENESSNTDLGNSPNTLDIEMMMNMMSSPAFQEQMTEMMKMLSGAEGEEGEIMIDTASLFAFASNENNDSTNTSSVTLNEVSSSISNDSKDSSNKNSTV